MKRSSQAVASKVRASSRSGKASPKKSVLLLDAGRVGHELLHAKLERRPSARNKSPWVVDVRLDNGRIALAHAPSLDMGGLCVTGSKLLMKRAVDSKGNPIGSKAVGAYGTPKCEFILQLVWVDEPENKSMGGCWCAAHPSLGEKLSNALVERNLISGLPKVESIRKEVTGIAGCDMRSDFLLSHPNNKATVMEVKTVLNTDYNPATAPSRKECVYLGAAGRKYRRAGIFPWGRVAQVGPDGEQVVSARAIKHIDELAGIARGDRKDAKGPKYLPMLVFMVVRPDVESCRMNEESCASFARHAAAAQKAGVRIVAHKVRWGTGKEAGKAFWAGPVPVEFPKQSTKRSSPPVEAKSAQRKKQKK